MQHLEEPGRFPYASSGCPFLVIVAVVCFHVCSVPAAVKVQGLLFFFSHQCGTCCRLH